MASIQRLTLLLGKTLKDRQGNKYKLLSVLLAPDGSPGKLIVENESGRRSQRLASGKVHAGTTSPRDILLKGPTRQRRAFNEWSTFEDDDEDDSPFRSPINFDDDDYVFRDQGDDTFFTPRRKRRARFGSYESPFTDDDDEAFEGPNLQRNNKGELEITIKVKR